MALVTKDREMLATSGKVDCLCTWNSSFLSKGNSHLKEVCNKVECLDKDLRV